MRQARAAAARQLEASDGGAAGGPGSAGEGGRVASEPRLCFATRGPPWIVQRQQARAYSYSSHVWRPELARNGRMQKTQAISRIGHKSRPVRIKSSNYTLYLRILRYWFAILWDARHFQVPSVKAVAFFIDD